MTKHKYLNMFLALMLSTACYAEEPTQQQGIKIIVTSNKPVCLSTSIEDTSKIIKNPGNCPIEILRRIGRGIAQYWPEGKNKLVAGTLLFNEFIGTPGFIRYFKHENLSKEQQESCNNMLESHTEKINELAKDFPAASEAITVKAVANLDGIISNLNEIINKTASAPINIKQSDIDTLKSSTLPLLENLKDAYGIFSLSESGIFSRSMLETKNSDLQELLSPDNITIGKYIDDAPLITLVQSHHLKDTAQAMAKLDAIPSMAFIKGAVASAGLDFEKDILSNHAQESILYINLTPTGEQLIPDVRWVGLVPEIEKLTAILPKLKNLCVQLGIFITAIDVKLPNTSVIKLSHCMVPQYAVYAALADRFCIVTSTPEGAAMALKHLQSINDKTIGKTLVHCNLYGRIKTSDFNVQLQQFLQSPFMVNQGVPPISNLTFMKDMQNIEACTIMTDKSAKIILDIPFVDKQKNN